jgi:cation:H+ antiporter
VAAATIQFILCAAMIIVAGAFLTRCADAIAERTGFGRLLVGSVLLAAATSLPELSVDVAAVRMGLPDLAVGDLLGSSLMNLLILAVLDLSYHSRGKMISRRSLGHVLSGSLSTVLTVLVGLSLLTARLLGDFSLAGISPALVLVVIVYLVGVRIVYHDQRIAAEAVIPPQAAELPAGEMSLQRASLGFAIAAGAVFVAGPFLAESAGELARLTGLGDTFVGTTLVALSTSLPELVTSYTAVRMGAFDLAVGNVFGSNAFNMVLLAPLDLVQPGLLMAVVSERHVITCLAVILATQVTLMGVLYQAQTRKMLIEPDAVLVIVVVIAGLALIYYLP